MADAPLHIVHMMRPTSRKLFSIERVFEMVRSAMREESGIMISCWAPERAIGALGMLRAAWDARRNQGDINHVTGDAHYLTWFLDPARTVLTVHDLRYFATLRGLRKSLYWLLWFRIPLARCARVTAISHSTKDDLLALAPWIEPRLEVVVNPLPEGFAGLRQSGNDARSGGALRLLQIGTAPPKNLNRHLDAAAGIGAELSIVGPIGDALREEVEQHPARTVIHGAVGDAELKALYRSSDILLFASLSEGFGLPILEAQAAGLPVIAGDNSAMPETAGGGALLVNAQSVDEIKAAIEKISDDSDLRAELIAKGKQNLARFAPETVSRSYSVLYKQMAGAIS